MNKIENKLVPELQFAEFKNDGEWNKISLIDTVDKKIKWSFTGGPFGSNLKASDYTSNGIRIIQLQNIGDGKFNDDYKIYTSKEKADELLSSNIYSGEIIISKMGDPVGRACLIPDNLVRCVMASDGIRLVVNEKKYSKLLIYYLINSKQIRDKIEKKATGSTRKRIGLDELKNIDLIIPESIKEQKKIADCLSSLDELITTHTDKLEAFKNHKKGLMQNLFPQEGQRVPNYRFPEFMKDGKWESTTVDDNCNVKGRIGFRGYTKEDLVSKEKGVLVIGGKHIQNHMLDLSDPTFLSLEKYYESPEIMTEINDIVFSQRGTLGDCAIIDREIGEATINPSMVLLKKIKCNPRFLYYILIGEKIQNEVTKSRTSAAIPMLSQKQIKEFSFLIPNPKEQQKIAQCLMAVDNLTTAQIEKIEQLKTHKKGLMQGLFPKVNA